MTEAEVTVLRLSHRPHRDRRVSTHVALVARAFGADGVIFTDRRIKRVKSTLEKVNEKWGNSFFIRVEESWRKLINNWQSSGGLVVHLTMYGCPMDEKLPEIRGNDVLIVIGAGKVPSEVFEMADFNIAIGNQPHSEIAALAVFLDNLFEGSELKKERFGGEIRVIPSNSGKRIEKKET